MARLDFLRSHRNRFVSNGSDGLHRTTFQPSSKYCSHFRFHRMTTLQVTQVDSTVLPVLFFDWTPSDSWFWPLESGREYWTCVAYFPGHSFPVRNDISHAEQELQQDKKRHWPSYFKRFKFQHKAMTNLKVTHPNIFCKVPMIAWESLFNGCMHTRKPRLATHRDICNHVLEEKKIIKRFKPQQKVKKYHKRYSS